MLEQHRRRNAGSRPGRSIGFWPANAVGDDIALYSGESRDEALATFYTLRQQLARRRDGKPNLALADFVAPKRAARRIISAASSSRPAPRRRRSPRAFARANDDYGSIMVKALADRIAEAFAERMHERVRREFWGYAAGRDARRREELIGEHYRGIRPAPGYPAQPDHTEKATLVPAARRREADRREADGELRDVAAARRSAASISRIREAHYFGVAKIERDQVEDYARRKGMAIAEVERWLAPILNYGRSRRWRRPAIEERLKRHFSWT